jgi:hypothetical protein
MDWSFLARPEFLGPTAGLLGVLTGSSISAWATRSTHRERLAADQKLAERKFEFDKDLAERKFRYDRDLHDHERRVQFAEEVLTAFYRAQVVLVNARSPLTFGNEGEERPCRGHESENLARLRDSYYVPIARLNKEAEVFAKLSGNQARFKAYFGETAEKPFKEIHRIWNEIVTAAEILINEARDGIPDDDPQFTKQMKDTVWHRHHEEDALNKSIDCAVKQIENICRPILQGSAGAP